MATKSSFKQPCPSCEAMVPIRDPKLIGRKIDCPKCKYRFVVEEPAEEVEDVEEVEEAPAKKGKAGATEITNQKPSNGKGDLQRRADDDEDVEEAPKKKKRGGSAMLIVGISLAAVAVVALAVGAVFLFSGGKSDDKPKGGPSANVNPGNANPTGEKDAGSDVAQAQKEVDKPKPKQEDVTNLLPNDTHAVLNLPLDHLLANPGINQALFKTPGAFHEGVFQRVWGVLPADVSRVVLGWNTEKKTVFAVMRTRSALKEDKIVAALHLKPEAPVAGQKYYLLTKPLDGLSAFLLQNALRKSMGVSGDQSSKVAMHFMDPFTVVCADVGPMNQFLQENGQPKHLTKSAEDEAAESAAKAKDAKAEQPGGPSGPRGMRPGGMPPGAAGDGPPGRMPPGAAGKGPPPGAGPQTKAGGPQALPGPAPGGNGAPPAGGKNGPNAQGKRPPTGPNGRMPPGMGSSGMFPGSGGPSDAAPVSSSYLTVDPRLKAILDQVEKVDASDGQTVLLSLALSTSMISLEGFKTLANQQGEEMPKIPDEFLKLGLESFKDRLKGVGFAVTALNDSKLCVNGAAAAKDAKLASEWEKSANAAGLAITEFLSKQGIDLVAKNPGRTNSSGLPGGAYPGSGQSGPFPGAGGGRGMPPGGFPGMQGPGGGRGARRGGLPGMEGPGGFPGQQNPGQDQEEEKGKDGDYQIWTKDEVLAAGVHYKMNSDRYQKVREGIEFAGIYFRGLATLSHPRSHIHDLAAAIQAYFHEKGHFPRGTVQRRNATPTFGWPPDRRLSWLTQILPYLGNGEFQGIRPIPDQPWYEGTANQKAGFTLIPYFLTPGVSFDSALVPYPNLPVHGPGRWAATHFVGIGGVGLDAAEYRSDDPTTAKLRGVFGYDRETKKEDIKDGLEQTIVAIQVPPEPKSPWIAGGGSTVRGVSDDLDCVRPFVCIRYPNKDGKEEDGTFAIMADGKVRFIPASIDPKLFRAMCTIAGEDKIRKIDAIAPEVPPPDDIPQQSELKTAQPAPAVKPPQLPPVQASNVPVASGSAPANPELRTNMLKRIGLAYHNHVDAMKKPPTKAEDLAPYYENDAGITATLKSGAFVVFWNASFRDMKAGTSNTVLGYEKEAPEKGGLVLMADGSVRPMNANEFKAAPKASGK